MSQNELDIILLDKLIKGDAFIKGYINGNNLRSPEKPFGKSISEFLESRGARKYH